MEYFPGLTSLVILQRIQDLEIESSSCKCSLTSIGGREAIQHNVFRIPNKSRTMRRDSRKDTGHSLDLVMKRICMELTVILLQENGITATQMVRRFEESGHPVFKSIKSWNSEKEE